MRRKRLGSLVVSLVLLVSLAACSQSPPASQPAAQPPAAAEPAEKVAEAAGLAGPAAAEPAATATVAEPAEAAEPADDTTAEVDGIPNDKVEVDPANFDRSEIIDNKWFPLKPGTKFVYEGTTEDAGETIPHRVDFIVTDLTKMIGGIRALVILDSDHSSGKLEELELTYFAQDKEGTVWHLGQYRETYGDIEFVGGRVWYVGNPPGAKAGIMMHADPQLGTPSYSEGYAPPPFHWTDRGRVFQMGQRTTVVTGSYEDVLVIEETDSEHPEAGQLKYYAQGVGIVRVGWSRNDESKERMVLIEHRLLNADELAQARKTALELEARAYMYCALPPAEPIAP